TDVLANVSHELRTPLTSIIGYVDVLLERSTDPQSRTQLEKVARNARSLLEMINRMLDISRINAGRVEMTVQSVPLGECVEAAWVLVEPQLAAKGLVFKVALPEEPLVVQGSFERLQQVFANLLGNAVKFTEQGEVGVRGTVEGRLARIDVFDTGIGIGPKDLPHIFEEFRQADGSIRRRFGGSGLGLAICKKIVEMHGGTIGVESRPGAGSTFTVRIPLERKR
ncbi:MAG: sensor histidine kinase, partial [Candidatus Xenobia bacterium]